MGGATQEHFTRRAQHAGCLEECTSLRVWVVFKVGFILCVCELGDGVKWKVHEEKMTSAMAKRPEVQF